jgi:hypothetical protein
VGVASWAGRLPDGVADGLPGGLRISVGVGTGGMSRTGGGADEPEPEADGVTVITGGLDAREAGDVAAGAPGRGGGESYRAGVTGWDVMTRSGAAPMAPAPPGAVATGGFTAGVLSSHPMVTATGRPNAIMPKNTYLGESRTE